MKKKITAFLAGLTILTSQPSKTANINETIKKDLNSTILLSKTDYIISALKEYNKNLGEDNITKLSESINNLLDNNSLDSFSFLKQFYNILSEAGFDDDNKTSILYYFYINGLLKNNFEKDIIDKLNLTFHRVYFSHLCFYPPFTKKKYLIKGKEFILYPSCYSNNFSKKFWEIVFESSSETEKATKVKKLLKEYEKEVYIMPYFILFLFFFNVFLLGKDVNKSNKKYKYTPVLYDLK